MKEQLLDDFTAKSATVTSSVTVKKPPFEILRPGAQTVPFVFASPHSGSDYSDDFIASSRLDPVSLRRSEDSFVDQLYSCVPEFGAPLIKANFPRAFVDPNREAYELDPTMFEDNLPDYVNRGSPRVQAGLGTVAKLVTNGENIYRRKLTSAEAIRRIKENYHPYHNALIELIKETKEAFGKCILIDCHSMPSIGGPMDNDRGNQRVDFILGNGHGKTCPQALINFVDAGLTDLGYDVRRNHPYSGGYTTRHYGNPEKGVHALQIEINRIIYMDEITITQEPGFNCLAQDLKLFVEKLTTQQFSF